MPTDALTIAPTLHQITPERVVFVYNTNQSGSLEVAQYYRDKRGVPNANLIGLAITTPTVSSDGLTCESLVLNASSYVSQIETPLKAALNILGADFSTDGISPIWAIILGYGIPLAFDDDGETIAVASRLHLLGKTISNKKSNHTFDRRNFKFFDADDSDNLFITAVLDGPTVASVKDLIDRSIDVDNQTFVTGEIVVDPYGKKILANDLDYQQDVLNFLDEADNFGLNSQTTIDLNDPYQEPTIKSLSHDSFYWGWFNPTYSKNLFLRQNERRVFLYNADDRAACNIHFFDTPNDSAFDSNGSDHWCNLAINVDPGYASCAGSVDDPGADAFLRPIPFFRALHQGATLGEAYLFASKFVSWKTVLIGDPLMVVNFPVDLPSSQDVTFDLIPNDELIRREKINIENSLAWGSRQARLTQDVVDHVVTSEDFDEALNLLSTTNNWKRFKRESAQTNIYLPIVAQWSRYIERTTNLSTLQWLTENNNKITTRLNEVMVQTGSPVVTSDLVLPSGSWEFTFDFTHELLTLEDIHFKLDVSTKIGFDLSDRVFSLNTQTSTTGWSYEGQPFLFVQLPNSGFPSNFSGRRIRFTSPVANYLRTTEVYYVRWTAIDSNGTAFAGATATERIIITA